MAGGQALNTLVDLFLATSPATLTAVKDIENEAEFSTTLLYQVMRAHDMSQQVQGGSSIQDFVYFDEVNSASDYQPMEEFAPQRSDHLTSWSVPWRFTQVNEVFGKHEKGLQNIGQLNKGARAMVYKDIVFAKWMNVLTSLNNHFERGFFLQPNAASMEATGGKVPYSLFATIHTFGALTTDTKPTATVNPGWTTIQGISPTTQPKWRNPVEFYTDVVPAPGTSRWTGYTSFMKMHKRLSWMPMTFRPEYSTPQDVYGFIFTSLRGMALYEANGGSRGDFLRTKVNDPSITLGGAELSYQGIPVRYVEKMDTAEIWPGTSGTVFAGEFDATTTEAGAATNNPDQSGPRFVWVVPSKYKKIIHAEHFLEEETPPASQTQPFDRVVYFDNWHNNVCRTRRKAGGVVAPGASTPLEDTDFTAKGI